jgi:formamidopyrimidine-DNA glycosylase
VPELPEVEVTRRQLEPLLVGRTIARVFTTVPSYFFLTPPAALARALRRRRVTALERVGKYIVARLDDERRLLLHLGMTGQLFGSGRSSVRLLASTRGAALTPEQQLEAFRPDKHTHLRLRFDDGGPDVIFRDARKFGKVQLIARDETPARLGRLGPDALGARGRLLFAAVRKRRVPIKSLLLDQSILAGVGNIYADEALFLAGVRPTRPGRRVTLAEAHRIARAIRAVLRRSIATGGSSISDYIQPDGSDGAYQDERRVYSRTGEPCPRCRAPIRRVVIGARSSHYCPRCQR